jgi:UDP-3-O-[3-hydroxymyristoyl] glucosamine N-acyltransferase
MKFTAKQIAEMLNGKIEGDPEILIWTLSKIEEGEVGGITFLANPKYVQYIYTTNASVVVVANDFVPEHPIKAALIRVENPYLAFASLLEAYNQIKLNKQGISKQCYIHETAVVGEKCYIGEFTYLGENVVIGNNVKIYPTCYIGDNVVIGDNTTIFAGVKLYCDTVISKNCTLHSGVVLGADGFGFAPSAENNYQKIAQIGNVIIEENVEIGANTTIDRATLGSTIIRKGVKIDNLIQIAHNVEIGENTVIAAQTGISGSTKIGKNCMIGGQVGIVGHVTIADGVKIQAQSGVNKSITKEEEAVQGAPAFQIKDYLRSYIHFKNLPGIVTRLENIEKKVKEI